MVQFLGDPLKLNIGDIVVEKPRNPDDWATTSVYYWVVYGIRDTGNPFGDGYLVFDLQDENNKLGPIVFRPTDQWDYEVIRG